MGTDSSPGRAFGVLLTGLLMLAAAVLAMPAAGHAASFASAPPTYVKSSDAPFDWWFQSSQTGAYGGVASRMPGETSWHRCWEGSGHMRVDALADGTYTAEVRDDYYTWDWAGRGISVDCSGPPLGFMSTVRLLVVDTVAPTITDVSGAVAGKNTQLVVSVAPDDGAPISGVSWDFGDGFRATGTAVQHSYFAYGTYHARVTVTDAAGNGSQRDIDVVLSAPAAPSTPVPSSAGVADTKPPDLRATVPSTFSARRGVRMTLSCDERCGVQVSGSLRVTGNVYRLPSALLAVPAGQARSVVLPVSARLRRLLSRARRRHERPFAIVGLRAADSFGNAKRYELRRQVH
jgi:hypothetical protein